MAQNVTVVYTLSDKISNRVKKIVSLLDKLEGIADDTDKTIQKLDEALGKNLPKSFDKSNKKIEEAVKLYNKGRRELDALSKSVNKYTTAVDKSNSSEKRHTSTHRAARNEIASLRRAFDSAFISALNFSSGLNSASNSASVFSGVLGTSGTQARRFASDVGQAGSGLSSFNKRVRSFVSGSGEIRKAFRDTMNFSFFRAGIIQGLNFFQTQVKILAILPVVATALGGLTQVVGALAAGITGAVGSLGRLAGALAVIPGLYAAIGAGAIGVQGIMANFIKPATEGGKQVETLSKQVSKAQKQLADAKKEQAKITDPVSFGEARQAKFGMAQGTTEKDKADATQAVADAQSNLNDLLGQQQELLDKMPPRWNDIYKSVEEVKKSWRELWQQGAQGTSIANSLISVLTTLNTFINSKGMQKVAMEYAKVFEKFASALEDLRKKSGADFAAVWQGAVKNLGSLLNVAIKLAPYLVRLGSSINTFTATLLSGKSFVEFTNNLQMFRKAGDDGKLSVEEFGTAVDNFLSRSLRSLDKWGTAIWNVFQGFRTLLAASGAIDTFESGLVGISQEFRSWTQEVAANGKAAKFFEKSWKILGGLKEVLKGIGGMFGEVMLDDKAVETTVKFLKQLGQGFRNLGKFMRVSLKEVGPSLNKLFESAGKIAGDPKRMEAIARPTARFIRLLTKGVDLLGALPPEAIEFFQTLRLTMFGIGLVVGNLLGPFGRFGALLALVATNYELIAKGMKAVSLYKGGVGVTESIAQGIKQGGITGKMFNKSPLGMSKRRLPMYTAPQDLAKAGGDIGVRSAMSAAIRFRGLEPFKSPKTGKQILSPMRSRSGPFGLFGSTKLKLHPAGGGLADVDAGTRALSPFTSAMDSAAGAQLSLFDSTEKLNDGLEGGFKKFTEHAKAIDAAEKSTSRLSRTSKSALGVTKALSRVAAESTLIPSAGRGAKALGRGAKALGRGVVSTRDLYRQEQIARGMSPKQAAKMAKKMGRPDDWYSVYAQSQRGVKKIGPTGLAPFGRTRAAAGTAKELAVGGMKGNRIFRGAQWGAAAAKAEGGGRVKQTLGAVKGIGSVVKTFSSLTKIFGALRGIIAGIFSPIGLVISAFTALATNAMGVRDRLVDTFKTVGGPLISAFKDLFSALGIGGKGGKGGFFSDLLKTITWITDVIGVGLVEAFRLAIAVITPVITFIIKNFTAVVNLINDIWGGIKKIFSGDFKAGFTQIGGGLFEFAKSIGSNFVDLLKGWVDSVVNGFKGVVAAIASGILDAIRAIPGVKDGWVPEPKWLADYNAQQKKNRDKKEVDKVVKPRTAHYKDMYGDIDNVKKLEKALKSVQDRRAALAAKAYKSGTLTKAESIEASSMASEATTIQKRIDELKRGTTPTPKDQAAAGMTVQQAAALPGVTKGAKGAQVKWDMESVQIFIGQMDTIKQANNSLKKNFTKLVNHFRDYPTSQKEAITSNWRSLAKAIVKPFEELFGLPSGTFYGYLTNALTSANNVLAAAGQPTLSAVIGGANVGAPTGDSARPPATAAGGGRASAGNTRSSSVAGGGLLSTLDSSIQDAARALLSDHPGSERVTSALDTTRSNRRSQHLTGMAMDIVPEPWSTEKANSMGRWVQNNAQKYGVNPDQVFYPARPAAVPGDHDDHVHIGFGGTGSFVDMSNLPKVPNFGGGPAGNLATSLATMVREGLMTLGSTAGANAPMAPDAIEDMISRAASAYGASAAGLRRVAYAESSYDVNSYNDWDVNAQNGTPSRGLFQFIEPTFRSMQPQAYLANPSAWQGVSTSWTNPLAQALTAAWAFTHGQGGHWATADRYGGSFGRGGSFTAKKPMMIGVGDKQPEEVRVTPTRGPNKGKYSGGKTTVVNSTINLGTLIANEDGIERLTEEIGKQIRKDISSARRAKPMKDD